MTKTKRKSHWKESEEYSGKWYRETKTLREKWNIIFHRLLDHLCLEIKIKYVILLESKHCYNISLFACLTCCLLWKLCLISSEDSSTKPTILCRGILQQIIFHIPGSTL